MQMKLEVVGGVEELRVGGGGNHREHSLKAQQTHNGLYNIGEMSTLATRTHEHTLTHTRVFARLIVLHLYRIQRERGIRNNQTLTPPPRHRYRRHHRH